MIRINKIIIVIIFAAFLSSCAKGGAKAVLNEGRQSKKADGAAMDLMKYRTATNTMSALAWIELASPDSARQTEAAIIFERPEWGRVNVMDALADVWAEAGSKNGIAWLYIPREDKIYSGRASRSNLRELVDFDWDVPEFVSILLGSPPIGENKTLLETGKGRDEHLMTEDGSVHLWADGKTGRIVKCARYNSNGGIDYVVNFADFKKVGEIFFPHEIKADFPSGGAHILVRYKDVSLNSDVDEKLFLPPDLKKAKKIRLKGD